MIQLRPFNSKRRQYAICPESASKTIIVKIALIQLLFVNSCGTTAFQPISKHYACKMLWHPENRHAQVSPHATLQAKKDKTLVDQIVTPIETVVQILSTPIESLALPISFPLAIIAFNIFFNSTTSIMFDFSFGLFYALIQQLRETDMDDTEDEFSKTILNLFALFGASSTALLISPTGFESRETVNSMVLILPASLLVLLFLVSLLREKISSKIPIEEDVDPSKRLMDLWDEKLSKSDQDSEAQ